MTDALPSVSSDIPANNPQPIVARAGRYYRNTRYLMAVLLVGMSAWFLRDGAVVWPRENRVIAGLEQQDKEAMERGDDAERGRLAAEKKKHVLRSDWDIRLQWILGLTLPPIGIGLLIWALRNSRGEIRLTGDLLSLPGHPPLTLADIKSVDNSLWDRKGIAYADYALSDGTTGRFRLDDFVYERPPIDAIYDRIAEHMGLATPDEDDAELPVDGTEEDTRV